MKLIQSIFLVLFSLSVIWAQKAPAKKSSLPFASPLKLALEREKFDAQYYRIEMQLDIDRRQIKAKTTIRVKSLQNDLTHLTLDFDSPLKIDSIGGAAFSFERKQGYLILDLIRTFQKNEEIEVWVAYSGNPQVNGSFAFVFDYMPDETLYAWTLSEPYGARQWWPCKDTPSDKADSVDLFIRVPKGNLVASNGRLVEVIQDSTGEKTFHWQERYPIATYLVSLVAGPLFHFTDYYHYSSTDSMLLDYYVFPEEQARAPVIFSEVKNYLDALSSYFGPYPFLKEKYGMAQFGWGGGMEHQTLTSIGLVSSGWTFLYVHELAHQWFGNQVTCASWQDIWLNEGFASYSEALYAEWAGFKDQPPGLNAYLEYMNTQLFLDDGTVYLTDTTSFRQIFTPIVYDKGSWILHMLRKVIGTDHLLEAFKQYLNDPRWTYGSVRSKNFKEICERVSGIDLEAFFDQWLNYPFYPKYEYEWQTHYNKTSGYQVDLVVRQIQTQTLYVMPIELRFLFVDETDTLITIQNDQFTQEYWFTFSKEPIHVVFDPNNWLLDESKETSTAMVISGYGFHRIFPNPSTESVNIELVYWQREDQPVEIYNLLGKKVRTLWPINRIFNLHQYFWDGKNDAGQTVSSGIYFLRAPTISGSKVQKVMIVR